MLNVLDATGTAVSINTLAPLHADGGNLVHIQNQVQTIDANGAAFQGVVPLVPGGVPVTPARSVGYVCTVAGPATFTFADGSAITLQLAANPAFVTLPFGITAVALAVGTLANFWNLK